MGKRDTSGHFVQHHPLLLKMLSGGVGKIQ